MSQKSDKDKTIDFNLWHTVNATFTVKFSELQDAMDFITKLDELMKDSGTSSIIVERFRSDYSNPMHYEIEEENKVE